MARQRVQAPKFPLKAQNFQNQFASNIKGKTVIPIIEGNIVNKIS